MRKKSKEKRICKKSIWEYICRRQTKTERIQKRIQKKFAGEKKRK